MTVQPPASRRSRWTTRLGWTAVAVAVALLIVLTAAIVRANTTPTEPPRPVTSATAHPTQSAAAATPSPAVTPAAPNSAAPVSPAPEPPATTPPAVPGDAAPPVEQAPVALTDSAEAVPEVVFSLGALQAVDGEAQGPGEVGGPAVRFTLTVRNDTAKTVSLAATIVNVYAGADQAPAGEIFHPGGAPLPREVKPGQAVTGTFLFVIARSDRDQVKITVDYSVGVPLVVFEGAAPA